MPLQHLFTFAASLVAATLVPAVLCHAAEAGAAAAPSRSTPEAEGVDSGGVLRFVEALENNVDAVHSVMLVRHGKVVAEGCGRRTSLVTCT